MYVCCVHAGERQSKVFGYAHTEHTRLHKRAHALLLSADSHWSTVRLNVGRTGRQRAVRA